MPKRYKITNSNNGGLIRKKCHYQLHVTSSDHKTFKLAFKIRLSASKVIVLDGDEYEIAQWLYSQTCSSG